MRAVALAYGVLVCLYLAWQLQPASLGVFTYSYDEGVYAQTAWAVQRGHELYAEVFSAQPPLVTYLLAGLLALTGPSLVAARGLMVALSLPALIGVALLAGRGAGWRAGLAAIGLLALSPDFMVQARWISPEVPAIALATLALGLAAQAERQRPAWWLAVGVVLALATLAKLSALVVIPALAILVLAGQGPRPGIRLLARDLLLVAAPSLLLWGLVLAKFDMAETVDQLITFRTTAKEVYGLWVKTNARMAVGLLSRHPLICVLALVGVAALWRRRQRRLLVVLLVFFSTGVVALLTHTPLLRHHLILVLPPLVVLGGVGLHEALAALADLVQARLRAARRLSVMLPVAALGLTLALVPEAVALSQQALPDADGSWSDPGRAVAALKALPGDDIVVLTDEQMIAFAAGRPVPPSLTDTSFVRITTGDLEFDTLVTFIEREQPAAILFWSGRFAEVPGFRLWVRQNYRLKQNFGGGRPLYVRR